MDGTRRLRTALVAAVGAAAVLLAAACDDDGNGNGNGDETPAATATVEATAGVPPATVEPLPTLDPSITPGPPERIELRADPQALACDGESASTVTARVLDEAGQPVADGTEVTFSVQALGTADPIDAETSAGEAQTSVTALGEGVGVVVNVSAEGAAASIRIDCQ